MQRSTNNFDGELDFSGFVYSQSKNLRHSKRVLPGWLSERLSSRDKYGGNSNSSTLYIIIAYSQRKTTRHSKCFSPWYNFVFRYPTSSSVEFCVNPPRHVVSNTLSPQVMFTSVCIKMLPFWLFKLRAYFPNTWTVDPLQNSMLPLNSMWATRWLPCGELLSWSVEL